MYLLPRSIHYFITYNTLNCASFISRYVIFFLSLSLSTELLCTGKSTLSSLLQYINRCFFPQTSSSQTVCSECGGCMKLAQRPVNVLLRLISPCSLSLSDFSVEVFSKWPSSSSLFALFWPWLDCLVKQILTSGLLPLTQS